MLKKEFNGFSCEPSPPSHTFPSASSTFNASIDGNDLAVESDQVHSPLVVRHKGRLPYKRKVSAVEQAAVKKSEKQPPKEHKRYNLKKLTYEERKAKLIERLNTFNTAAEADDEEDDE